MKVLIVASYNKNRFAPFIVEQANALAKNGVAIDYYGLKGKGIMGYLNNLKSLKQKIKEFKPDVIHAHYGLSGLLACLQRDVPVITTYHGSDINSPKVLRLSRIAMRLSAWNIFVSEKLQQKAGFNKKYTVLPCGIDLTDLQLTNRDAARRKMGLECDKRYVLFAGAFDNEVKNAPLAKEAIAELNDDKVVLLELKGYTRDEVTLLMCACDAFLMTSKSEGSPQVIKEAMACGCPIVSVDVGDVKERTMGVDGCFITTNQDSMELTYSLLKAFDFKGKTQGLNRIREAGLDNKQIAEKLLSLYSSINPPI